MNLKYIREKSNCISILELENVHVYIYIRKRGKLEEDLPGKREKRCPGSFRMTEKERVDNSWLASASFDLPLPISF